MIMVLWRRSPTQTGFTEWQDLLLTLALFELPLKVVLVSDAAESWEDQAVQQRLQQLADIGISEFFLCGQASAPTTDLPLTTISPEQLAGLCQQARQLVHC
ncbi:hypothetical protein [Alcanivorax sp. 1008]|uniref:hypothetical protein n=1 Tax=Alcanivorax sp. 1008 TaxID=2816853 RepID=UPI001DDCAAB0|nr:hypothetical protein [Alcanivorax sp. 1008]MCC1498015.1 hypothetical protein [Alcanivorax sp. 1008]